MSRRARGIYKDPRTGRFRARFVDAHGRRRSKTFKRRVDAMAWLELKDVARLVTETATSAPAQPAPLLAPSAAPVGPDVPLPEDGPPHRPTSFVYFVATADRRAIKIGVAADPRRRLTELQISHAEPLTMLALLGDTSPGGSGQRLEELLHRRFDFARLRGEWFCGAVVGAWLQRWVLPRGGAVVDGRLALTAEEFQRRAQKGGVA